MRFIATIPIWDWHNIITDLVQTCLSTKSEIVVFFKARICDKDIILSQLYLHVFLEKQGSTFLIYS